MSITIRLIRDFDVPIIRQLERATLGFNMGTEKDLRDFINSQEVIGILAISKSRFQAYKVEGYLFACRLQNFTLLNQIVVHPRIQRQGIGSKLIVELQRMANDIRTITPEDNLPAHLFLRKNGFKCTRIKKHKRQPDQYVFVFNQVSTSPFEPTSF